MRIGVTGNEVAHSWGGFAVCPTPCQKLGTPSRCRRADGVEATLRRICSSTASAACSSIRARTAHPRVGPSLTLGDAECPQEVSVRRGRFTPWLERTAALGQARPALAVLSGAAVLVSACLFPSAVGVGAAGAASTTTVLYASPQGTGSCTSSANACQLTVALDQADAFPGAVTIVLASGTPDSPDVYAGPFTDSDSSSSSLTIEGTATGPASYLATVLNGEQNGSTFTENGNVNLSLSDLTVTNGLGGTGSGGGITAGTLSMVDTYVDSNSGSEGGGIYADGSLTISGSIVEGNSATGGYGIGGGISAVDLTMSSSTVEDNSASNAGGGISIGGGDASTMTNSTISGNTVSSPGGIGGGISYQLALGPLNISQSLIAGNSAAGGEGGGIYLDSTYGGADVIQDSTIAENSTTSNSSDPGPGSGAGVYTAGAVEISDSTIANNATDAGYGGGLSTEGGGSVSIAGSIVAENSGGDCAGPVTDAGSNLESGTSCQFTASGSLQNTDPDLGALAANGGPTDTMALPPSSPAVDAVLASAVFGGSALCSGVDQRGEPRLAPGAPFCDMGAYEYVSPVDITTSALPAGSTGAAYSASLAASGGSPPYAWKLDVTPESSSLPAGLSLSSDGTISGTPTVAGTYAIWVTATDSADNAATRAFDLVVAANGYWILTSDGGVSNFNAPWYGSPKATGAPGVVGITAVASGGYDVLRTNGGVLNYGAPWYGSLAGRLPAGVIPIGLAAG